MSATPLEARCDTCKQMRPVFLYEAACGMHLDPRLAFGCEWCQTEQQPLLCVRCWDSRKTAELSDARIQSEQSFIESICRTNREISERNSNV